MHTLICGVTQSGKTTLARMLARTFEQLGHSVIVFDPLGTQTVGGNWGTSAIVIESRDDFLEYISRDEIIHAHVFVDEAHEIFALTCPENFWLLTRGRHFGLNIYAITQRPKLIAPTCRLQCGRCYMFRLGADDARELGADFGHSGLEKISLDTGDFLCLNSGSAKYSRANVFHLLKGTTK